MRPYRYGRMLGSGSGFIKMKLSLSSLSHELLGLITTNIPLNFRAGLAFSSKPMLAVVKASVPNGQLVTSDRAAVSTVETFDWFRTWGDQQPPWLRQQMK